MPKLLDKSKARAAFGRSGGPASIVPNQGFAEYVGRNASRTITRFSRTFVPQFVARDAIPGEASNSTLPSLKSRAYLALNPSLKSTGFSGEGFRS